MTTREANQVICTLQDYVDDHTAALIEQAAIDAGYWIRCSCRYVNLSDASNCEGCGARLAPGPCEQEVE